MHKKGIIAVSFGTTYTESYKKNIFAVEEKIKTEFPHYVFESAYTSSMIIKSLEKRGININDINKALENMLSLGVKEVFIQPTHLLPGIEYEKMCSHGKRFENSFEVFKIGEPLLYTTEDLFRLVEIVSKEIPVKKDEALVLMGHGTSHHTNTIYCAMDYIFKAKGYENVFVATVEGYPEIEDIGEEICKKYNNIVLAPFMLVAGDHAENDMAGEDESWKTYFKDKGKNVRVILKGLGEYEDVRQMYTDKIKKHLEI